MTTLNIQPGNLKSIFSQLSNKVPGALISATNEYELRLGIEMGEGVIKGVSLKGGMAYLEFDLLLEDDLELQLQTGHHNPIMFAYCSEGSVKHKFGAENKVRILERFQTAIGTSTDNETTILRFSKNESLKMSLITVARFSDIELAEEGGLKQRLEQLFIPTGTVTNSMYLGSYNLKIADKVAQIRAIRQEGIVKSLLTEGLVHVILALEIQQHEEDQKRKAQVTGSLNLSEMESIKEVTTFIKNFSETQLSINKLSKKSGLSAAKLQEGFKLMHGRTVSDYIRDVRVTKSEELIKTTDMNISEVVYSVGFTSRSYFSKIFKAKYNCSPKIYKDKQHAVAVSA